MDRSSRSHQPTHVALRSPSQEWLSAALLGAFVSLIVCAAALQAEPWREEIRRMEVVLERQTARGWEAVEPGLVLERDDRVRFRVTTNLSGYLYIVSQGTSGASALLFPSEKGVNNRIVAGTERLLPPEGDWFGFHDPAGHERLYWILSPLELALDEGENGIAAAPSSSPGPMPRCDSTILRSRGDCVDSAAGIRAPRAVDGVPQEISHLIANASRELFVVRENSRSVVCQDPTGRGPILFEFRVAHK